MKKIIRSLLRTVAVILIFWTGLTFWAEWKGPNQLSFFGALEAPHEALVVFDPDPIYDLDAQVCERLAKGLAANGQWRVSVASVASAEKQSKQFDLYVFCANTYNWAPDWAISKFIRRRTDLENKPTVAITLGAGSTTRAQRLLETRIKNKKAKLIDSQAYWLLRPNDELKMDVSNVLVATNQAERLGIEIAKRLAKPLQE